MKKRTEQGGVENKLGMESEAWRADFAEWRSSDELRVETAEEISSQPGVYVEKAYFVGANMIYCTEGSFRFTISEDKPITLNAGEMLVVYARRFVTIEALDKARPNRLSLVIVAGVFANEYVAKLGYYDLFHAACSFPGGTFRHLKDILSNANLGDHGVDIEALSLLNSMLRSTWEEIRMNGDTVFFDAVRAIHRNILEGKARVKDVGDQLDVSRAQLHRIFIRNGFESIGAFIKETQFRYALKLLGASNLTVAKIARKLGFSSPSNFTTFIRNRTGKSPMQFRGKCIRGS